MICHFLSIETEATTMRLFTNSPKFHELKKNIYFPYHSFHLAVPRLSCFLQITHRHNLSTSSLVWYKSISNCPKSSSPYDKQISWTTKNHIIAHNRIYNKRREPREPRQPIEFLGTGSWTNWKLTKKPNSFNFHRQLYSCHTPSRYSYFWFSYHHINMKTSEANYL